MRAEQADPMGRPAHLFDRDDEQPHRTGPVGHWPRPVREIRAELAAAAQRHPVDPAVLDRCADELRFAAAIAAMFGGDPAITLRYADATTETAEVARLLHETPRAVNA